MRPRIQLTLEQFEDTVSVYRRRTDKTGRKKKDKRTNNDLQSIHIKPGVNSGAPEG